MWQVNSITWAFRWISYIDFMRYAWEMMGIATFHQLELDPPIDGTRPPIQSVYANTECCR